MIFGSALPASLAVGAPAVVLSSIVDLWLSLAGGGGLAMVCVWSAEFVALLVLPPAGAGADRTVQDATAVTTKGKARFRRFLGDMGGG